MRSRSLEFDLSHHLLYLRWFFFVIIQLLFFHGRHAFHIDDFYTCTFILVFSFCTEFSQVINFALEHQGSYEESKRRGDHSSRTVVRFTKRKCRRLRFVKIKSCDVVFVEFEMQVEILLEYIYDLRNSMS